MRFTKRDFYYCIFTGFYAGLIIWRVLEFLNLNIFDKLRVDIIFHILGLPNTHVSSAFMMLVLPICWIIGVNLGYFLGRFMPFFNQFGRFAVVGFTNFIVYTGILNIFLWWTGISSGIWYSVFVSIAFIISVLHSYGWNKYWVFESGNSGHGTGELTRFLMVTGAAGLINVGVASFLVNVVHPLFGITPEGWANIGGIAGSAVALVFSFIGTRLFVFKKSNAL